MRGVDLPAKIRNVGRILGAEIVLKPGPMGQMLKVFCPELDNPAWDAGGNTLRSFEVHFKKPSGAESALRELHQIVYRARGEFVYRQQFGLCCFCGKQMPANAYELDHKETRGAHGRSDRVENLQACCTGFNGCDGHRRKHGG